MSDFERYQDAEGRIKRWPAVKRRDARRAIIELFASKFESNRDYSEKEVNAVLNEFHTWNDPAFLRRELVDRGLLARNEYGDRYWRPTPDPSDPA